MEKPIKRLAVIHDLCGVGKAALTNIIPILSVMEIEVCPIPTVVLSTHTGGFGKPALNELNSYINNAVNHYKKININFEGLFIGYLGNIKNIQCCLELLNSYRKNKSIVLLDPIFADNGKLYSNFTEEYVQNIKKLIKFTDVITPNYTEACILCDMPVSEYASEDEIEKIFGILRRLGAENIIITSIPLSMNDLGTGVYNSKKQSKKIIHTQKQKKSYPGTGDIFTSVLLGELLNEIEIEQSAEKACRFVEKCMMISSMYDYPAKEGVLLEKCLRYLI
ncbi:MAG: pyridoxamine kinase [Clostridium butyricum]|nr:pyridoxamine kinase [Clostridium butyricum]